MDCWAQLFILLHQIYTNTTDRATESTKIAERLKWSVLFKKEKYNTKSPVYLLSMNMK